MAGMHKFWSFEIDATIDVENILSLNM